MLSIMIGPAGIVLLKSCCMVAKAKKDDTCGICSSGKEVREKLREKLKEKGLLWDSKEILKSHLEHLKNQKNKEAQGGAFEQELGLQRQPSFSRPPKLGLQRQSSKLAAA